MSIWIAAVGMGFVGGLWIAWPFLKSRTIELSGSEGAISIYRDQLDEIDRDHRAGLIGEEEAAAARQEVERRTIVAARTLDAGFANSRRSVSLALGVLVMSVAIAVGGYTIVGSPDAADEPLAERRAEELIRRADAGDIASRIKLLIKRTSENPDSFEDWWTLAQSYAAVGDHASAVDAYRYAADLAQDRPAVLSAYAEAMVLTNGNKVPTAARVIFEQIASDTGEPRARYYVALAKAQAQDFQGAVNDWAALAASSASDAPWMPTVRRDIVNMTRFLKQDVTQYLPDATPAEIAAATVAAGENLSSAHEAAEAAEAAIEQDRKDYRAWLALAEARSRNGDPEGAAEAIADAKAEFAGAPFLLQKLAEAERALGLDALGRPQRGPTSQDIAAASEMSQEDRDDMIAGTVAGLAARLEENPNDPDGWVMLIRSYATLGDTEAAKAAVAQARSVFKERPNVLSGVMSGIADLPI